MSSILEDSSFRLGVQSGIRNGSKLRALVVGLLNHRGAAVPVVDLKHVFGLPGRYRRDLGRIVLVSSEGILVGFEADAMSDVLTVPRSEIEPPLSTIEKIKAEYIEGCVRRPQGLLILLSAPALIHGLRVEDGA